MLKRVHNAYKERKTPYMMDTIGLPPLASHFAQIVREYTGPPVTPQETSIITQPSFKFGAAIAVIIVVIVIVLIARRQRHRR